MQPDERTDLLALTDAVGRQQRDGDAGELAPGTLFGRFRVLRLLGRGGMAVVYLCEQLSPVQRLVAVKRIAGVRTDPVARLRFEIERQSLARLNDPGIARIWDAGSAADGSAWFAMEYVEGLRLDHWRQERKPAPPILLRLLAKLCDAIAHAHRQGIVHCDLKPANVMVVDGIDGPQVRVIDFGIARMATLAAEGIAGTPAYMAPEQVSDPQSVDARADVHALAVLIGEALTGQRMHGREWTDGGAAALAATALSAHQRREIAALLARASARLPAERYPDAHALGDELRRLLAGQPLEVLAHRRRYRWACRIRRYRWPLLGVAGLLLSSTAYALHAWQQYRSLQAERDLAEQMVGVLLDTYRAASPIERPGGSATARELLAGATQRLEARELPDEVRIRVLEALADVQLSLELYEDSEASLRKAGELARGERRADLALKLANSLHHAGRYADAAALAARVAGEARPGERRFLDARLLGAEVDLMLGQPDAAEAHLAAVDPWIAALPDDAEARALRIRHALQRGNLAHQRGKHDAGQRHHQQALAVALDLWGPEDLRTAAVLSDLALGASAAGDHPAAIRWLEQIVTTTEAAWGRDSADLAIALGNLGVALQRQGDARRAESLHRRAIGIFEATLGRDSIHTGTEYNNLATALEDQQRHAEADPHYRTAVAALHAAVGDHHLRVGIVLHNHGRSRMHAGDLAGAEALLSASRDILLQTLGEAHPRFRVWQSTRAALDLAQGTAGAAATLEALLPRLIEDFGERSREVQRARRALGR
ncbi:MAG: serine/threonine-protein kinase [Xanthomonadales bacterium]|jgi:tetratricopeptide (TPR) repeat protein/predicted Ser/Thr protein kinase|nr:serine/threonine-protein kinase [Xanthomonadales bacterium]